MRKLLFTVLALSFATSPAWALEEIIKNYRGIRSLGMGGVVTTTGLYDEALFGNPAMQLEDDAWKLSILGLTVEGDSDIISDYSKLNSAKSASGSNVLSDLSGSGLLGRDEHVRLTVVAPGFYSPHFFGDNMSFAAAMLVNTQANLILRDNATVENQTFLDVGPSVGFGRKFLDGALDTGINLHLLYRLGSNRTLFATDFLNGQKLSLSQIGGKGIGIDSDIGAYYKLPWDFGFIKRVSVGGSINDLLASQYGWGGYQSTPPGNNRSVNTGVRLDLPDLFIVNNTLVAVEMQDMGTQNVLVSFWKRTHIGAETHFLGKLLAVRGGFNQGYLTAGVGADFPLVKLDFATYGEEVGANAGQLEDRRYAFRIAFEI